MNRSTRWVSRFRLRQYLERHIPAQPHIGGAVDVAHPAACDQTHDAVGANHRIDREQGIFLCQVPGRENHRGRFEESG
jgi:hypothetical protein